MTTGVAVGNGSGIVIGVAVGAGVAVGNGEGRAIAVAVGSGVGNVIDAGVAVGSGLGRTNGVAVGRGVGNTIGSRCAHAVVAANMAVDRIAMMVILSMFFMGPVSLIARRDCGFIRCGACCS